MTQKRKRCDKQFKIAVARVILVGEMRAVDLARELGIKDSTLRRWAARRSGHEPVPDAGGEPQAEARACQAQGGERDTFKSQRLLREQAAVKEAKFAFIDRHLDERGVSAMCRALGGGHQAGLLSMGEQARFRARPA